MELDKGLALLFFLRLARTRERSEKLFTNIFDAGHFEILKKVDNHEKFLNEFEVTKF